MKRSVFFLVGALLVCLFGASAQIPDNVHYLEDYSVFNVSTGTAMFIGIEGELDVYELVFEITREGILVHASNGELVLLEGDVMSLVLGSTEVYLGMDYFSLSESTVILGSNELEVKGNSGAEVPVEIEPPRKFYYLVVGSVILIIFLLGMTIWFLGKKIRS